MGSKCVDVSFLALRKNQNERSTQLACHFRILLLFKMKPHKSSRWKNGHKRMSGWKSQFSGSQRAGEGSFRAEEDALKVCMCCRLPAPVSTGESGNCDCLQLPEFF